MAEKREAANTEIKPPQRLMCAAIDFGTTYSGYAFSMKSNPAQIFCPSWKGCNYQSMKTPTCLLLDSNEKFNSFGYIAQERYSEIANDDEQDDWYYFKNFKMKLHSNKVIIMRILYLYFYTFYKYVKYQHCYFILSVYTVCDCLLALLKLYLHDQ